MELLHIDVHLVILKGMKKESILVLPTEDLNYV